MTNGMRTFFIIWFGQIVSLLGTGLTSFALGLWVYQKTGSATDFAMISLFTALPSVFLAPFTGTLVDRWNRKTSLLISDIGSAVSLLLVPIMLLVSELQVWHIYVSVGFSSLFGVIRWPSLQSSISLLLSKEEFTRANGILQIGFGISMVFTPILGVVFLNMIGMVGLSWVNIIGLVLSILSLLIVKIPKPVESEAGRNAKGSFWKETKIGWTYIQDRKGLLSLLLLFAFTNFNVGMVETLITPLLMEITTVGTIGTILTIAGIGMLAGGVVIGVWGGPKRKMDGILGFGFLQGALLFVGGFMPNVVVITIVATIFLFSTSFIQGCSNAIWQSKVHQDVQGRVFSVRTSIALSIMPISYGLSGLLAEKVFNPLLVEGGLLANNLGKVIGVGPNMGIALLFSLIGLVTMVLIAVGYLYRSLREVETELPDVESNVQVAS